MTKPARARRVQPAPILSDHALALASDRRVQAGALALGAVVLVSYILPALVMFAAVLAAIWTAKRIGWL